MKKQRSFFAAASAVLCGSLAASGLVVTAKILPNQPAAGFEDPADMNMTETTCTSEPECNGGTTPEVDDQTTVYPTVDPKETTFTTTCGTGQVPPEAAEGSGSCGKNLVWRYDKYTRCLSIQGSGVMDPKYYILTGGFDWADAAYVVMEPGVTGIEEGAFEEFESAESIQIPDTVTYIGKNVFRDCGSLKEIAIPDSVQKIGANAFDGCISLEQVTLPNGLETLESELFRDCVNLRSIIIPNSVKYVKSGAFKGCQSLNALKLPDSVIKIESNAFDECSSLKEMTLPYNVRSTGDSMFAGCTGLEKLTVLSPYLPLYTESDLTGCVLRGYNSSSLQRFASDHHLQFESLGEIPYPSPSLGDFDGDGDKDVIDAQLVLTCFISEETEQLGQPDFYAADIDNNHRITALDAQYIMLHYLLNDVMEMPTDWQELVQTVK